MKRHLRPIAFTALTLSASLSTLVSCSTFSGPGSGPGSGSGASKQNQGKRGSPARYGPLLRDPLIRAEIKSELQDMRSLALEKEKLHALFADEPLKGPLTMARLEDVLVAEYRANALQMSYAKQTRSKAQPEINKETRATLGAVTAEEPKIKSDAGIEVSTEKPLAANTVGKRDMNTGPKPTATSDAITPKLKTPSPMTIPYHLAREASPPSRLLAQAALPDLPESSTAIDSFTANSASGVPADEALSVQVPGQEPGTGLAEIAEPVTTLKKLSSLESSNLQFSSSHETPFIFDIPVTYNARVRQWIHYFQTQGRVSFRIWLERSSRFLPIIQYELTRAGLPQDLVYVAMIESGFSPNAVSHAGAMGMWQFIRPTANRYGLRTEWWVDERKDFYKSTRAAISYMTDLYRQFNSWYLVAASYNMGENGVRRLLQKHNTNNFWELADKGVLPAETTNYVPKIIAAMLISKAPALYGFRDLDYQMPMSFEYFKVPGGTDLNHLSTYLGVSEKYLKVLNPELIKGFVPRQTTSHKIRIPKGSMMTVSQYVHLHMQNDLEAAN